MDKEKEVALEQAYKVVAAMDDEVEALLKGEDAGATLTKGGEITTRMALIGYRTLLSNLANVLCGRIDEQAEELQKAKVEGTITEKILAAAEETPEGALIVSGDAPNEFSVVVLRNPDGDLLVKLVRGMAKYLAGGTDDILAIADKVFTAKKTDFQNRGYEGAPVLGTVVVQQAQTGKVRKSAAGPTEPENPLHDVGEYLTQSAAKRVNRSVNLT